MRTRDNLIIDATVLATYLLAANPAVTGYTTHEWVSLAFGATALVHLALHAKWVTRAVTGWLSRTPRKSRVLVALDALTAAAVTAVMVSGLAVSRAIAGVLGVASTVGPLWHTVHAASATAVVVLAVTHLAMHWRWVATAIRLHVVAPLTATLESGRTVAPSARTIAVGIPAILVAALVGLAALGLGGSGGLATASANTGSSTGQTLTCPATGCTATSCHATSGQRGGGGPRGFGG